MAKKFIKIDCVGTACDYFHDSIDGTPICVTREELKERLAVQGIRLVSRKKRCPLDDDYKPKSRIEKLLHRLYPDGGMNNSDLTFTVSKDGYQTLIFEHAGQMYCSDWVCKFWNLFDMEPYRRK